MTKSLEFVGLNKPKRFFDIRALLLISFILGLGAFFISNPINSFYLILATLSMLLYLKKYKRILIFLAITSFFLVIFFILQNTSASLVKDLFGVSFIFILKFLPLFIVASIITHDLPTGNIIEALALIHLPKPILLSVVVALRFIPTIRQETSYILQSMKLRSIGFSFKNILLKPLITVEYILIPLLFRSLTIAEELAATAITRGVENPGPRSSYFEVKFKPVDFLAIFFILTLLGFLVFLEKF